MITALKAREITDEKSNRLYLQLQELLRLLRDRSLPTNVTEVINKQVEELNASQSTGKTFSNEIQKSQNRITSHLAKELKIVPKGYYRNLWVALGMTTFGLPIGIGFGLALKNMAFLGIGLPIGIAMGVGVGASMDNKAAKEGRQLDIELKH